MLYVFYLPRAGLIFLTLDVYQFNKMHGSYVAVITVTSKHRYRTVDLISIKGNMNNPGLKNAFQRVPIA